MERTLITVIKTSEQYAINRFEGALAERLRRGSFGSALPSFVQRNEGISSKILAWRDEDCLWEFLVTRRPCPILEVRIPNHRSAFLDDCVGDYVQKEAEWDYLEMGFCMHEIPPIALYWQKFPSPRPQILYLIERDIGVWGRGCSLHNFAGFLRDKLYKHGVSFQGACQSMLPKYSSSRNS